MELNKDSSWDADAIESKPVKYVSDLLVTFGTQLVLRKMRFSSKRASCESSVTFIKGNRDDISNHRPVPISHGRWGLWFMVCQYGFSCMGALINDSWFLSIIDHSTHHGQRFKISHSIEHNEKFMPPNGTPAVCWCTGYPAVSTLDSAFTQRPRVL